MSIFVVIGAKGGTGCEIVKRLIEKPASEVNLQTVACHARWFPSLQSTFTLVTRAAIQYLPIYCHFLMCASTKAQVSEVRALVRDPSTVRSGLLPDDSRVKLLAGDARSVRPHTS